MKTVIFLAVLLGAVCITCTAATPYSSNQQSEDKLLNALKQLSAAEVQSPQDSLVEEQEEEDDTALAQLYLHLLENEVQKQNMSDEDRAEMESIFSKLKQKFRNFRNKIVKGYRRFKQKVKKFFHRG